MSKIKKTNNNIIDYNSDIECCNYVKKSLENTIENINIHIENLKSSDNSSILNSTNVTNSNILESFILLNDLKKILDNKYKIISEYEENKIKIIKKEKKNRSSVEIIENKNLIDMNSFKYIQYSNIIELNNHIDNPNQRAIINRISTDADYAKVYLQNFIPNTDPKKKELKGTIKILGNYNKQKKSREAYDVKIFDSYDKHTFWCSCADHKFNSTKKNIVCKHICFIVCKVLKILQIYFFETKQLTSKHLEQLLGKFDINSEMWSNVELVRKSNKITIQDFKNFPNHIQDICTFCYDDMTDIDIEISVICPICKHCFHEECMDIWLESQSKCSYCLNVFWKYYKRIKNGEKEIDLGSNQL